ncbi:unnamed protein product [Spirodela intermedia]|uniref:Uncharacterized protein n=1 Tax=Spirodela intermedia TaxID=51605 RepID=A0A7I8JG43_SPIIN|nr:unnamed protein product [Spirodela intermedia]CAA6669130.1 unnamed protein product [Spirodela intermedia]
MQISIFLYNFRRHLRKCSHHFTTLSKHISSSSSSSSKSL